MKQEGLAGRLNREVSQQRASHRREKSAVTVKNLRSQGGSHVARGEEAETMWEETAEPVPRAEEATAWSCFSLSGC